METFFTSESVSEGHPDKLCDQISDAVLDACLSQDPHSCVACETFASTSLILIGGEISTRAHINLTQIARDVAADIGYVSADVGLDAASMAVLDMTHHQSPDIAQGVHGAGLKEFAGSQGAGDQGIMFGFACRETPEFMPAPLMCAHAVVRYAATLRHERRVPWLRPDAKSQVTVQYEGHRPVRISAVVFSQQHDPSPSYETIRETLIEEIVRPALAPTGLLDENTRFFINPTGRFVIGGPFGDTGLTGRKIIVDTYGGMGRHGGGSFSGKDASKVDRSAAYMARYIAKNIVAADLAERCEVQLAYAIGVPYPVSLRIETFGTARASESHITHAVKEIFDLTPAGIVRTLDLCAPRYRSTAVYGHFGREQFPWERTDCVCDLQRAVRPFAL
ncbi:methionine adenosyltransferase, partial [Treponema pallidum]